MKIATWNVNSVNARLPHLLKWLASAEPDVVCLQETKCVDESFPYQELHDLGYYSAFYGQRSYNGVAIISKHEPKDVIKGLPDDDEESQKRLIAATINGVRIVDVYVPNGQSLDSDKFQFKLDWLQRLRAFFDANYRTDEKVLLCGDFNVAPLAEDVWNPGAWEGFVRWTPSPALRPCLNLSPLWGI